VDTLDGRRWITLGIVLSAVFIVGIDNTVLNVAIPTIMRDLQTDLPSLQWVITGYALTFATLLIIGGRLADIYGARRLFLIGLALFGAGSLVAALAMSVPMLILGEAVIEGIGASLMLPATLSIMSTTFHGHERAMAFAAWGAVLGTAASFGPALGGFFTTYYTWRWSFGINVVIAPIAIAGAVLFMRVPAREGRRQRIDVPGAILVASGMFLLVFGLSEGGTYGWLKPLQDLSIGGLVVWPASRAVSVVPFVFAAAAVLLGLFVLVERVKERRRQDPLFEFGLLENRGFRYGLLTTSTLAMGQFALMIVLALLLQDGRHLSAVDNGLWLLPMGIFIIIGSQIGGRLTLWLGSTVVVRIGLAIEVAGLMIVALVASTSVTFLELLPGFALFGLGVGFASAQLTNVVLSGAPSDHSGAASGANTTMRQVGAALGVALIGTLLSAQTIRHAVSAVTGSTALPPDLKAHAAEQIHRVGVGFTAPPGTSPAAADTLQRLLAQSVTDASRPALLCGALIVALGLCFSFLIPKTAPLRRDEHPPADVFEPFEILEPDPAL
jgi:EmrB/QacA subfamily drug resistance transporter